ncbi:hypothetical protein ZIOFF_032880 [Zingiber officinale]|uniref:Uncharacterized protein n=2 Tax=Zingiber officinale TaxID=94328 RepID=A0A8J5L6P0_ZINOF|nr:hypothetical protein ZIOFF_032880 [Zingiber officinale]
MQVLNLCSMDDKKLDFDAPLLSIRRLSAEAAAATAPSSVSEKKLTSSPPRRFSLPFYKSELKSGPVSHPGAVAFVWEKSPGHPKNGCSGGPPLAGSSVRTRKASSFPTNDGEASKMEGETEELDSQRLQRTRTVSKTAAAADDDDVFIEAPETLSRTESLLMNCSMSGLSSFREAPKPSDAGDYMISRFLQAAEALADDSPRFTFRKAATPAREPPTRAADRIVSDNLRKSPLLQQRKLNDVVDDDDHDSGGRLRSRGCGLLPKISLMASLCLLNPFAGLRKPRRRDANSLHHFVDEESLTTRGTSPYRRRSNAGRLSPSSPLREGKGFLGVPNSGKIMGGGRGNPPELKKTPALHDASSPNRHCEFESNVSPLQSPLLAPKSPAESWLMNTLTSVAPQSPRPQPPFLRVHVKQTIWKPVPPEPNGKKKPSKPQRRRSRLSVLDGSCAAF